MTDMLRRLVADDGGDDLVEYALLTSVIALASVAAVSAVGDAINATYLTWDAATQDLWEPEAPAE